jgi:ribosomal protein S27AE
MKSMASTKGLSESELEDRLRGRPIALVKGSFKNIREPAQWLCLTDSKHGIFNAPPKQIINANGSCPKCGKVAKLTEEIVTEKLGSRPIELVKGSLQGSDVKATWLCLTDPSHGKWEAAPSSILNSKSGCPRCSGKLPLNEEEIKSRLNDRNLALVSGSYIHSK